MTWLPGFKAMEHLFFVRAKLMLWLLRVCIDLVLAVELYPLVSLEVNLRSGQMCYHIWQGPKLRNLPLQLL